MPLPEVCAAWRPRQNRSKMRGSSSAGIPVRLNKNTVNGTEPFLRLIGDLPAGTPVAFEAAFGWGWLVRLLGDYGFDAHLVPRRGARRSPRRG
jgi:hypothetical protein